MIPMVLLKGDNSDVVARWRLEGIRMLLVDGDWKGIRTRLLKEDPDDTGVGCCIHICARRCIRSRRALILKQYPYVAYDEIAIELSEARCCIHSCGRHCYWDFRRPNIVFVVADNVLFNVACSGGVVVADVVDGGRQ